MSGDERVISKRRATCSASAFKMRRIVGRETGLELLAGRCFSRMCGMRVRQEHAHRKHTYRARRRYPTTLERVVHTGAQPFNVASDRASEAR